jgi:hypothetical protein
MFTQQRLAPFANLGGRKGITLHNLGCLTEWASSTRSPVCLRLFISPLTVRTPSKDRSVPSRDEATPPLATCSVVVRPRSARAGSHRGVYLFALGGRTGTLAATPLSARMCIPRKKRLFGILRLHSLDSEGGSRDRVRMRCSLRPADAVRHASACVSAARPGAGFTQNTGAPGRLGTGLTRLLRQPSMR